MNRKKICAILMTVLFCTVFYHPVLAAADGSELADSGINYTECVQTIENPGAGYTSTLWYNCKPNDTPVYNPTGNLVLMFINIGAFSSGSNGTTDEDGNYTEGMDYDLDTAFFDGLRGTFENCRKNGCTIALRFRYDEVGKSNPEPSTFEQVLKHISQIKESGLLEEYKDILCFVESGFVGAWGEQHSGKYTSLEYKAQLLDAMLDCVPDDISVTVRTPNTFAAWAGIEMDALGSYVAEPDSDAARVGMYNDGYMGSDSDLGTYSDRAAAVSWMNQQMLHTYYGGEFSGNLEWAQKYDTYLPENAIPEMYQTHLSYINSNIYQLYKDYTFGEAYDVAGADHSAYYGETVFQFIRDHLGYRFVLRDSDLSVQVPQGGILSCNFSVENTGFANPIKQQKAQVILERDGNYVYTQVDIDPTKWYSCTTNDAQLSLKIPGYLEKGDWNLYLRLSVGKQEIGSEYMRTVRFANEGTWNPALGANYLGTFTVTDAENEEQATNHTFVQTNAEKPVTTYRGDLLTVNQMVMVDGTYSGACEWDASLLYAQDGENQLYITNDDANLYVMADIAQNAVSPVYNIQIWNETADKWYWMYYMPNGYVYFNNGAYDGCICKYIGNCVEFQIPFGDVMQLEPGTVLSAVRVSIQDSSVDGWPGCGDVKGGAYTISDTFDVYTAYRELPLAEHSDFTMSVRTSFSNPSYQWYLNDTAIEGAAEKSYTISDASQSSVGTYSVRITSESGTQRNVSICRVTDVLSLSQQLTGDIDKDGSITMKDLLLLQKHLVHAAPLSQEQLPLGDLNGTQTVNIWDCILLKQILTQQ
ncbi:MAG: DUF4832 domain-containing protein [Ruminococcus sp.]